MSEIISFEDKAAISEAIAAAFESFGATLKALTALQPFVGKIKDSVTISDSACRMLAMPLAEGLAAAGMLAPEQLETFRAVFAEKLMVNFATTLAGSHVRIFVSVSGYCVGVRPFADSKPEVMDVVIRLCAKYGCKQPSIADRELIGFFSDSGSTAGEFAADAWCALIRNMYMDGEGWTTEDEADHIFGKESIGTDDLSAIDG